MPPSRLSTRDGPLRGTCPFSTLGEGEHPVQETPIRPVYRREELWDGRGSHYMGVVVQSGRAVYCGSRAAIITFPPVEDKLLYWCQ